MECIVLQTGKIKLDTLSYKTKSANKATVTRDWFVVDADSKILGRFASGVARLIRGKHKPDYTPHVDCGDKVIVINAEKVKLTGKKWNDKQYISHSGYPGGQKKLTARQVKAKNAAWIIEKAVKGMLPKTRLGRQIFKNLYVYEGPEHPHQAQNPKVLEV